jgi:hypothetical protein
LGHSKAIATLLALLLLGGCASLRWSVLRAFREPGEHLAALPEQIWDEYDCDSQNRPFFLVEKYELIPKRVEAGGEFGHRLVYVMCPKRPTGVVRGQLSTRIRFRGSPLMVEVDPRYEIKPGRWVVDAFVTLPENAEPGVYAYELEFRSRTVGFAKSASFVVTGP